ncbi:NAD(P)H-dependent flavin oxidoreductase [Chitinophaga lutea]
MSHTLSQTLGMQHPLIMAPMFLVSNEAMMKAAIRSGIAGTFPSLNFRKEGELPELLERLNGARSGASGTYGVNLIVQKTNPLYKKHLDACVAAAVPFYITSLGNPREVIDAAHSYGAKVLCDVTNLEHAAKAAQVGADGLIAVCAGAGGHAGPYPMHVLVPALKKEFPHMPVVAAGGIATGRQMASAMILGADAVSVGTRFIASTEASVSEEYKQAIVDHGMEDIVLTERLSGTPCNIINTPTAQKLGYKQSSFEKWLSRNPRTRKYFKMMVQMKGMKKLEKAVKPNHYTHLWSAGQSVEMVEDISGVETIVARLLEEYRQSVQSFVS